MFQPEPDAHRPHRGELEDGLGTGSERDRDVDAGMVAKVMDEVRLAGITTISIAADPAG